MKKIGLLSLVLGVMFALSISAAPPKPANLTVKNSTKKQITEIYFYDEQKDEYSENLLKKAIPPSKTFVVMIPPGEIYVYVTAEDKDGTVYAADFEANLKAGGSGVWDVKEGDLYVPEEDPYGYEGDYEDDY